MKNKILFIGLILPATLIFCWRYSTNQNQSSYSVPNTQLGNINQIKEELPKSLLHPIKIEPLISDTTEKISENYLSQIEILDALKKIKGDADLNTLALFWKSNACQICLNSLKQILSNSNLNKELRTNAAFVLAKIGTQESVIALMQSLNKKIAPKSEKEILQKILSGSISAIYEPEGIGALAYILTGQQKGMMANRLPATLISNMNNAITTFSDKNGLAYEIGKQYFSTQNSNIQKAIIEIAPPQTLAALAVEAKATGDTLLQRNILEKLSSNPNSESLDALMSVAQKNLQDQDAEITEKLNEWTQNNFKTDRDGHLIDYLSNPDVSEKQREIAAELLTNITKNPDLLSEQENMQIQEALNKYHANEVTGLSH